MPPVSGPHGNSANLTGANVRSCGAGAFRYRMTEATRFRCIFVNLFPKRAR